MSVSLYTKLLVSCGLYTTADARAEQSAPMKWPERIIASLGRAPRVGDWYAGCCIEDFHQIADAAELESLLELYDDEDSGGRFWKTETEGRAELTNENIREAHRVLSDLMRKQGLEPTPAAMVEVLNCGQLPDVMKLAIAIGPSGAGMMTCEYRGSRLFYRDIFELWAMKLKIDAAWERKP